MKILHIVNSDDRYGSAQSFLELLKQEINMPHVTPYVVTPRNNNIIAFCKKNNISCSYLPYWPFQIPYNPHWMKRIIIRLYYFYRFTFFNTKARYKLSALIKQIQPDLVHTNSCIIDLGAQLSKIHHIPHVWHLREFGKEDYNFYSLKKDYISYMNKYTTRFIAISQAVKEVWVKNGLDPQKIEVICHGVDAKKFAYVDLPSHPKLPIRLVMCGSFGPAKGQLKVLEALSDLTEIEKKHISIDFYGAPVGEYYRQFHQRVTEYNLYSIVQERGYVSNLPEILPLYDAAIMYSRAEAMGRVTIEYMLAGLCPIVPRRGANIELIEENGCGLLFDYEDPSSLTKILQQMIANPNILETYAKKAYKVSREKYDSNKNIPHIIELFKRVAKH